MTEEQTKKMFHDLKNDLAAMTALLNLHKLYKDRVSTEEMLNRLIERQTIISTAYEKLYQENDYPFLNFRIYIEDLLQRENRTITTYSRNVKIKKETADIRLPIKQAIPFAQILFELISNSYRHAFKDFTGEKLISFKITEEDKILTLHYTDNGHGLPEDFNLQKTGTLGMQFINSISRQLGGQPIFDNCSPGMRFTLKLI